MVTAYRVDGHVPVLITPGRLPCHWRRSGRSLRRINIACRIARKGRSPLLLRYDTSRNQMRRSVARQYRVVDCSSDLAGSLIIVPKANTPEEAARLALGEVLVRSGRPPELRARVYYEEEDQVLSMVRLYSRAIHR